MSVYQLKINNPQIRAVLEKTQTKKFDVKSRAKGFKEEDYDAVSAYSTSDTYLSKKMLANKVNIEFAYNIIIGETEGGSYLLSNLKPILNFGKFYTSGYDPRGFVGWHDDTDIYGYYIMLTLCTSDDGFFRYCKNDTHEIITVRDKVGWLVKGVKLGYNEDDVFWHCALTNSPRYTFLLHYEYENDFKKAMEIVERD